MSDEPERVIRNLDQMADFFTRQHRSRAAHECREAIALIRELLELSKPPAPPKRNPATGRFQRSSPSEEEHPNAS